MKKSLFFVAATLVLASCNNDVKIDENVALEGSNAQKEIAFSPYSNTAKRAAALSGAITTATFPTDLDMTVAAWEQGATGRDYFAPATFTHDDGTIWKGGKYWPLSAAYINFLALANAHGTVTWGNSGTDTYASKVVVEMTDNYAIGDKQHDLIYAIGHGQVTQTGNALNFPDKVDMTFQHAQAYLEFNLKAADVPSKAIKIKNIEIYGARFAGTATITHSNYNAQAGQATTLYWTSTTQTNSYKCVLNDQTPKADAEASIALNTTPTQMGKILVVPNMSAADTYTSNGGTKMQITYYLDGKDYIYEYIIGNDTYEAGKKYIYDVTFQLHEICVNASVQEWRDGGTTYVEVPTESFAYVASTGETGTFTLPSATAGTYSCTITGLPADNYKAVIGTGTGEFITAVTPSTLVAVGEGEALNVSFTVTAATGKNQTVIIQNDEVTPQTLFTLTITQP